MSLIKNGKIPIGKCFSANAHPFGSSAWGEIINAGNKITTYY